MLHDVVSGSGLAIFAEVSLVLFLLAFVVVVVRALTAGRSHYDALARLPLDDDQVQGAGAGSAPRTEP